MPANLDIVIDCLDRSTLGRFWAAALGYRYGGRHEEYAILLPAEPGQPPVLLQQVAEQKAGKARIHLDIRTADVEREVGRLEALGARRADVGQGEGRDWVVMADPEGNGFCVCPGVPLPGELLA